MSIITFGFYLVIIYVVYYIIVFSYDVLTNKSGKLAEAENGIQYDFGHPAPPKIATLDDNESNSAGGLKQSLYEPGESTSIEVTEDLQSETSVDLA
ncbi:MAG: hypothetical protein ACR2KZ_21155 [Segetibacter sp.]